MKYEKRLERNINIPLRDGKKLHAILRGDINPDTPVVIMMHGRPGSGNELLQYLGARYLFEDGLTTLRLFMYNFGQEYRDLLDCTLDTHIQDFEDAVAYLRDKGVKKVFAIGHSYGGITILGSKAGLDGAVLWDPSHGLAYTAPEFDSPDFSEITHDDIIVGVNGYGYINSTQTEVYNRILGDTTAWAKDKNYPLKFILASAGPLAKYSKRYYDVASEPKALVEMKDAHHSFEDSDEVMECLFRESAEWLKGGERLKNL